MDSEKERMTLTQNESISSTTLLAGRDGRLEEQYSGYPKDVSSRSVSSLEDMKLKYGVSPTVSIFVSSLGLPELPT